jgi:hypothetical protein
VTAQDSARRADLRRRWIPIGSVQEGALTGRSFLGGGSRGAETTWHVGRAAPPSAGAFVIAPALTVVVDASGAVLLWEHAERDRDRRQPARSVRRLLSRGEEWPRHRLRCRRQRAGLRPACVFNRPAETIDLIRCARSAAGANLQPPGPPTRLPPHPQVGEDGDEARDGREFTRVFLVDLTTRKTRPLGESAGNERWSPIGAVTSSCYICRTMGSRAMGTAVVRSCAARESRTSGSSLRIRPTRSGSSAGTEAVSARPPRDPES